MFEKKDSRIIDCVELIPNIFKDDRGSFIKTFHTASYKKLGLDYQFCEEYYSRSFKNVIRGLHFQNPPMDHSKLVYCIEGSVFDVIVDLRVGSPTFGMFDTFTLSAETANILYIPRGLAHGFCSNTQVSTMIYKTSTVHDVESDTGILWNSLDIPWPTNNPVISERDKQFISFKDFKSPFVYQDL